MYLRTGLVAVAACLLAAFVMTTDGQPPPAAQPRAEDPIHRRERGIDWKIVVRPTPLDKETKERWEKNAREHEQAARIDAEHLKVLLTVSPDDKDRYREFLKSERSGLLVLVPDRDCVTDTLVRADPPCADFLDGGSTYSFRTKQYLANVGGSFSQFPFHDIRLNNGLLSSNGFLEHGIILSLGDVPIESLDIEHPAARMLTRMSPSGDVTAATVFSKTLNAGLNIDGYRVANSVPVVANNTYVIRLIAYKPVGFDHRGERTKEGYKLLLAKSDRRMDLTIAFRIVRQTDDGRLTLLWRELRRKHAPVLNFKTTKSKNGT